MKQKIKIAVVDDNEMTRQILTAYLKRHKAIDVIIACSNGNELIEAIQKEKPDIVISDLIMPIMDGVETTEHLSKYHPEIKILIFTVDNSDGLANDLIEKGANVFLLKNNGIDQIADAIYTLFKYEYHFAFWGSKKVAFEKNGSQKIFEEHNSTNLILEEDVLLNDQEKTILKYLCEGLSSKHIGEKMHLSYRTIQNKRVKLHKKTNTDNLAKLIDYAIKNKII
jgi:two-component system response regulator DegU